VLNQRNEQRVPDVLWPNANNARIIALALDPLSESPFTYIRNGKRYPTTGRAGVLPRDPRKPGLSLSSRRGPMSHTLICPHFQPMCLHAHAIT